ncbi:MAG: hypothetical protein QOF27_1402 [Gaiellaceae bacterium]|jgi:hypothetical protein|nr:hypothetical protein [Gaiellaceae bacterium]
MTWQFTLVQGNVDLHAIGWLLVGSIPGIWISSRFTCGSLRTRSGSVSPACSRSAA